MPDMQKDKKIELEHKKLLTEYNAILISLTTVSIGIGGLAYTITNNIIISFLVWPSVFLSLIVKRKANLKSWIRKHKSLNDTN